MSSLTYHRLIEVLAYDPETGLFTWLKTYNNTQNGKRAGVLKDGYIRIKVDGVRYYAHRLAWLATHGIWPTRLIDHINGVKHDNRLQNLRDASRAVNAYNIKAANRTNKLGVLGVFASGEKFQSQISIKGKKHHLGVFDSIDRASDAYRAAKREHHTGFTL